MEKLFKVRHNSFIYKVRATDSATAAKTVANIKLKDVDDLEAFNKVSYLLDMIRADIAKEHDTISAYRQHVSEFIHLGYEEYAKVLEDIAHEEEAHLGELQDLMNRICPECKQQFVKGIEEVREMVEGEEKELYTEEFREIH